MRKCWLATKTDSIVCLSWSLLRSNDRANSGCALPRKVSKRSWNTSSSVAISWQLSHSEDVCRRDAIMGRQRCNIGDEIMELVLHCKFKQTRCCKQLRRKQRLFQRLHQPLQKDIAFVIRGARTPRKVLWRKSSRSLTVEDINYVRMPPGPSLLRRKNMWEGHRVPCHYERRPPGPIMLTTINMREKFVFISLKRNRMKEGLQVPYCWVKWNLSTGWQMNPCNINKPHASLIWVHILV